MSNVTVEKNSYTVEPLYQWDLNQVLTIYGLSLPSIPEIHFANDAMDRAIVRQARMDSAGVITVDIPNSLLQKPYKVKAYVCIYQGTTFESLYKIEIPVKARTQPSDYTLADDEEVYSFNALENAVNNCLTLAAQITAEAKAIQNEATDAAQSALTAADEAAKNAAEVKSETDYVYTLTQYNQRYRLETEDFAQSAETSAQSAETSAATVASVLSAISNEQLADNAYFLDPINQKGAASYSGNTASTIDRWRSSNNNTTVVLTSNGITISAPSGASPYLLQYIENPSRLFGCTVTLSALMSDGTLYTATSTLPTAFPTENKFYCITNGVCQLMLSPTALAIRLLASSGGSNSYKAVKLELGNTQTLARKNTSDDWVLNDPPPNKALELAKCQRYFQVFSSEAARPTALVDYRPPMRANPTTGTLTINGVTYYYADANL